MGLKNIY